MIAIFHRNKEEYDQTLRLLAQKFKENFKKYESKASEGIRNAGPKV